MTARPTAHERRRTKDRRRSRVSLRYPDRRLGFERRAAGGPVRLAYLRMLARYRERPLAVAGVLVVFVVLNVGDLLLTLFSVERGAVEMNPVMARLLAIDLRLAATLKISIAVTVAVGLWLLRRYRRALEVSLLVLTGLFVLFLHQVSLAIRVSA